MAASPKVVSQNNYREISRVDRIMLVRRRNQNKEYHLIFWMIIKEIKNVNIANKVFEKDIQANNKVLTNENDCMESQKKTLIALREAILTIELALKG